MSPCSTSTSSNGTPSRSATIWLNAVSWPWPCGLTPTTTSTLPVGEHPDGGVLPAAGAVVELTRAPGSGARPHISVNVDTPRPSWTRSPASRRRFCSARSSSYPNISLALAVAAS